MGSSAAGGEPHLGTGGEAPLQPLRLASGHKQQAVRPWWMPYLGFIEINNTVHILQTKK